jgi:hypothetical protein
MSKQVSDRVRSTRTVTTLVFDTAEATGHGLEKVLGTEASSPNPVSCVALFHAFARFLESSKDEMVRADEANELELSNDAAPRARRDEAFQSIRKTTSQLRSLVVGLHGEPALVALVLGEPCPNDPSGALDYARTVEGVLADASVVLPPPLAPSGTLDRTAWSAQLRARGTALASALSEVKSQEVLAKTTLAKKVAAIAAHDLHFRTVVATMTAWWRVLGRDELIEKLESDLRPREPGEPEEELAAEPTTPTTPIVQASGS